MEEFILSGPPFDEISNIRKPNERFPKIFSFFVGGNVNKLNNQQLGELCKYLNILVDKDRNITLSRCFCFAKQFNIENIIKIREKQGIDIPLFCNIETVISLSFPDNSQGIFDYLSYLFILDSI